jgi:hypothetical protein
MTDERMFAAEAEAKLTQIEAHDRDGDWARTMG